MPQHLWRGDAASTSWCLTNLGSTPASVFFEAESMSSVVGVELPDGRRVALKRRQATDRVVACSQAHRAAWAAGVACPELLAGPTRLDDGTWMTAERWVPDGSPEAPPDAATRYADLLHLLIAALRDSDPAAFDPPPPWAFYDHATPGRVWPPAASQRWDPESPVVPAELRRLAAAAGERLRAEALPVVVGHSDLNGLNVRWAPEPIVHDWDSLAARPEAVLAGIMAVNHVELPGRGAITALAETRRALELYQRSRPFSDTEVEIAWAAGLHVAAYNAAFEYLHGARGAVAAKLANDGSERLRLAGC